MNVFATAIAIVLSLGIVYTSVWTGLRGNARTPFGKTVGVLMIALSVVSMSLFAFPDGDVISVCIYTMVMVLGTMSIRKGLRPVIVTSPDGRQRVEISNVPTGVTITVTQNGRTVAYKDGVTVDSSAENS